MFDFFIYFWAVVDAQSIKRTNFCFYMFYGQKTNMADIVKFGYGCINGFIAQKRLIFAEGNIMRKCR